MEFIETRDGGVFVAGSRVSLASVILDFRAGDSPETIQRNFPTLTLAQVYGAIAHCLNHPEFCDQYLARVEQQWADLARSAQSVTGPTVS